MMGRVVPCAGLVGTVADCAPPGFDPLSSRAASFCLIALMTRDDIFKKVQTILVDALAVDEEEVTMSSVLTKDLGAESIDFLDIVFKIEQAFGSKIAQGELFPEGGAQDPKFVQNGKITPDGLASLKARMPHVDFSAFEKDPQLSKVGELFTVETLVKFIEHKLKK
jgi:acyl carrier protein